MQDGQGLSAVLDQLVQLWLMVRAPIVAPLLQLAVNLCLVMVTMLFVERIFMCGVLVVVKLLGRTPKTTYKFEPMKDTDLEYGNSAYPMVLVQIPMYNEKEVLYKTTHFFPQFSGFFQQSSFLFFFIIRVFSLLLTFSTCLALGCCGAATGVSVVNTSRLWVVMACRPYRDSSARRLHRSFH